LLHFCGLVFSAPRNDVFMEAALRSLPLPQVVVLLALLLRLLRLHGEHTLAAAAGVGVGAEGGGGGAHPLPSLSTSLDWLRLVLDAHFAALLLQCAWRYVLPPLTAMLEGAWTEASVEPQPPLEPRALAIPMSVLAPPPARLSKRVARAAAGGRGGRAAVF
jgi:hypothetical protein